MQPEYLTFRCGLQIEAAAAEGRTPGFHMVAYTGGVMRIPGFPHPVVVDLEGLAIERQDIPVRLDHSPKQGVGHTRRVAIDSGQVVAEGLISRDTSWARDVARSAANGFPWQASIGAAVVEAEFVPTGGSVQVNGRSFDGPLHVVRQAILKEISFVDSGADSHTSARIAAHSKEQASMDDPHTPVADAPDQTAAVDTDTVEAADTATATAVADTPAAPREPAVPDTVNASASDDDAVIQIRRRLAAETRRVEAVRRLCAGRHGDIEARAIEEGWDESRTELHILRASRPQLPAVRSQPRNTSPQVFEAVALMAAGMPNSRIEAAYAEPVLEAADKLRGVGIQEFCELASARQLPRFRRDASGWLQAAFSTASLPGILSNIANKMLLEGYNYIEDAWRQIAKLASVNDFKEHTRGPIDALLEKSRLKKAGPFFRRSRKTEQERGESRE